MSYGKRSRAPHGVSTYLCCCLRISGEGHLSLKLSPYYRHFSLLDLASALFTRPLLLLLVLLLSNYAGHFHPIIWTETGRAALLAPFLGGAFPLWRNSTGPQRALPWRQGALVYQRGATHVGLDVYQDPAFLGAGQAAYRSANGEATTGDDGLGRHIGRNIGFQGQLGAGAGEGGQQGVGGREEGRQLGAKGGYAREEGAEGRGYWGSAEGGAGAGAGAVAGAGGSEAGAGASGGRAVKLEFNMEAEEASEATASGAATALAPEEAAAVREIVGGGDGGSGGGAGGDKATDQLGSGETSQVASGAGSPEEGSCGNSPYVTCWTVSVPQQRACRKVYPRHLIKASQGPIGFVGDLVRKRQRLLLTIPRHGLGNSLRGYVSSFVYAALSGRRLVRFHGAEHAKVFDTLCHSFRCGFEGIESNEFTGGPMAIYKQLELLNPVDINSKYKVSPRILSSLRSTQGLFVSKSPHFYDGFWLNFPLVQTCVFTAFGCSSTWCVRSRAIHALLGAPTPLLQDVVNKVLMRHVAKGQPAVPAQRDTARLMFDVALHFRTRPAAIESKKPGEVEGRRELIKIGCGKEDKDSGEASQFLKSCLWDCLGGILQQLVDAKGAAKGGGGNGTGNGRKLDILLATDNEALRPSFVDRLHSFGTVFYSSGVIVHSSKSASEEAERLPTMAEFHLMSRSHTILEAGSYISTFAYFSGLLGNGTLAGIDWLPSGKCALKKVHKGVLARRDAAKGS